MATHDQHEVSTQKNIEKNNLISSLPDSPHDTSSDRAENARIPNHDGIAAPMTRLRSASRFNEEWDATQRGSSILDGLDEPHSPNVTQKNNKPQIRGVLRKASLRRGSSLKKPHIRQNSKVGSIRQLNVQDWEKIDEKESALVSPVPTNGNPTELLAVRFQVWRKVLKEIITNFREIQVSYDHRAKIMLKISNVMGNSSAPPMFLQNGGIHDATNILCTYYKSYINETSKSKEIDNNVIARLIKLRNDLRQKIKDIKNLSGDFKNSLDKEMENTRRAVNELEEYLGIFSIDPAQATGKKDPYLLKLTVDHLIEKQIEEENYLHQAYLNLESSGRDLEVIIVSQIHKSYMAYADILRREADATNKVCDELDSGPLAMPKDQEWNYFINENKNLINPSTELRQPRKIKYSGMDDDLVLEIRAGPLERKSKFLKTYTPGWYVLSPTYLHEFKSLDKSQAPIMSWNISEQILGPISSSDVNSNEFVLKCRQTGVILRPHSWVFRCESRKSMLLWYEALRKLIEIFHREVDEIAPKQTRSSSDTYAIDENPISDDEAVYHDNEDLTPVPDSDLVDRNQPSHKLLARSHQAGQFRSYDLLVEKPQEQDANLSRSPSNRSLGSVEEDEFEINLPKK